MMNLTKLMQELVAVCPSVVGVASDGRVDFTSGSSWRAGDVERDADCALVAKVLAAHDSTPTRAELRLVAYRAAWTIDEHLEALHESAMGRPEKLTALNALREQIRQEIQ